MFLGDQVLDESGPDLGQRLRLEEVGLRNSEHVHRLGLGVEGQLLPLDLRTFRHGLARTKHGTINKKVRAVFFLKMLRFHEKRICNWTSDPGEADVFALWLFLYFDLLTSLVRNFPFFLSPSARFLSFFLSLSVFFFLFHCFFNNYLLTLSLSFSLSVSLSISSRLFYLSFDVSV